MFLWSLLVFPQIFLKVKQSLFLFSTTTKKPALPQQTKNMEIFYDLRSLSSDILIQVSFLYKWRGKHILLSIALAMSGNHNSLINFGRCYFILVFAPFLDEEIRLRLCNLLRFIPKASVWYSCIYPTFIWF